MRFLSYKKGVLGLGFHYVRPLTPRTTQQPLEREKKKKRNGREDEIFEKRLKEGSVLGI
jgi:hypothetical protein